MQATGHKPRFIHHTSNSSTKSPAGSSKNVRVAEVVIVLQNSAEKSQLEGSNVTVTFAKARRLCKDTAPFSAALRSREDGKLSGTGKKLKPPLPP